MNTLKQKTPEASKDGSKPRYGLRKAAAGALLAAGLAGSAVAGNIVVDEVKEAVDPTPKPKPFSPEMVAKTDDGKELVYDGVHVYPAGSKLRSEPHFSTEHIDGRGTERTDGNVVFVVPDGMELRVYMPGVPADVPGSDSPDAFWTFTLPVDPNTGTSPGAVYAAEELFGESGDATRHRNPGSTNEYAYPALAEALNGTGTATDSTTGLPVMTSELVPAGAHQDTTVADNQG